MSSHADPIWRLDPDAPSAINSVMQQATLIDYPGKMAALMFTAGCNFRCGYCHNFATLGSHHAKTYSFRQLADILDTFRRQWTSAVTISGGEPTLQPALLDTIAFIKDRGFAVKLDSNGSNPRALQQLLPLVDYVAMDIKCPIHRYHELVDFNDENAVRTSIRLLIDHAKDYEFRTTLVEPYFAPEDFHDMGKAVQGAKTYALQAFIPHDNLPDPALRLQPRTRPSALHDAQQILAGYVQNVIVRGD